MTSCRKEKFQKIWFLGGLIGTAVMLLPYLLLGQEAIVTYHDQLDGEMIAYILQAKNLFSETLPEFMNGADKTALMLPAPGFLLLFFTGNDFGALIAMQLIGSLCGYVGMYFLARELTGLSLPAAMTALLYAYLPFLPVYGLSQYGLPLLVYCFLQLGRGCVKKRYFVYMGIYALCSSLVLIGFGVLAAGLVWACVCRSRARKAVFAGLGLMLGIYGLLNFRLLSQILMGAGEMSHKAEYVLYPEGFFTSLLQGFLQGGQHSQDEHGLILAAGLLMAAAALLSGAFRQKEERSCLKWMAFCVCFNLVLSFLSALWSSAPGIFLRTRLSAVGAFQVQRLLWLAPCFWYLLLALLLSLLCRLLQRRAGRSALRVLTAVVCAFALGITGVKVLLASNLKPNIQKLRNPDYGLLSYADYYGVGVLSQAEEFLLKTRGQEKEEYRVVSLGIDPAAALYHGFYCLDGYSNNYSLEYKHSFRRVIAPELEKSQYLREYFDDWGNRCYLLSAECPGYYTIEKNGFYFQDYDIDTEALKELGGDYLFSAAYIMDAEAKGLALLNQEPFETPESYYRIYLYEIK